MTFQVGPTTKQLVAHVAFTRLLACVCSGVPFQSCPRCKLSLAQVTAEGASRQEWTRRWVFVGLRSLTTPWRSLCRCTASRPRESSSASSRSRTLGGSCRRCCTWTASPQCGPGDAAPDCGAGWIPFHKTRAWKTSRGSGLPRVFSSNPTSPWTTFRSRCTQSLPDGVGLHVRVESLWNLTSCTLPRWSHLSGLPSFAALLLVVSLGPFFFLCFRLSHQVLQCRRSHLATDASFHKRFHCLRKGQRTQVPVGLPSRAF